MHLKNICQIHPNTPIKCKYKYKYFILWVFKYKYKYRYLRIWIQIQIRIWPQPWYWCMHCGILSCSFKSINIHEFWLLLRNFGNTKQNKTWVRIAWTVCHSSGSSLLLTCLMTSLSFQFWVGSVLFADNHPVPSLVLCQLRCSANVGYLSDLWVLVISLWKNMKYW